MIDRRKFISLTAGVGGTATLATACSPGTSDGAVKKAGSGKNKKVLMHVGTQRGPTNDEMLQYFKRHGVNHICGYPLDPGQRGHWSVEDLEKTRDLCEQHGISLDLVQLPFLRSSHVDRTARPAIMLGENPERDKDIEDICTMIKNCAAVGVPAIKYNMSILGVLRTSPTPGRGGSSYSTWRLVQAKADPPLTRAGMIEANTFWERITDFLERVIPVAEEYKIRMACHPHDPGVPPEGFQGVDRVLGTVDGLKQFISIQESPYHGLNLCLGTTAEMLQDPGKEIHDVIRYFGSRKKIFNIHFRNIRGKRDDFQEVYPDEGDMDMVQVALTLKEVDYPYMLMPDHMPRHPDDPNRRQAYAFGYGYIKGILQAISLLG